MNKLFLTPARISLLALCANLLADAALADTASPVPADAASPAPNPAPADANAGPPDTSAARAAMSAAGRQLELHMSVAKAALVADGGMLHINFKISGAQRIPVEPKDTYVIDEASGEKFFVANLVRIGPAAQLHKRAEGSSFLIFDNRYGHLKPGSNITLVVGGLRQEHIVVAQQ